jgi:Cu+-exporting ATPase
MGISDLVKQSSAEAIKKLRELGIRVIMATGDNIDTANAVGKAHGIDEVHAVLSPADKIWIITELKAKGAIVALAGDGTNDAPALAEAQIGVALASSSDQ